MSNFEKQPSPADDFEKQHNEDELPGIENKNETDLDECQKTEQMIELAAKDAEETAQKMKELAASMGISDKSALETASSKYLEEINQEKEKLQENSNEEFPDINEGSYNEEQIKHREELQVNFDAIAEQLKEGRIEYVREMIKISTEHALEFYKPYIEDCPNKMVTELVIANALNLAITDHSQEFIESGDHESVDLSYSTNMTISGFTARDKEINYVTEYSIEFDDGKIYKFNDESKQEGIKFLNEAQQKQVETAKKSGDLNEEKEKNII